MGYEHIAVRPITPALGARVDGIDLNRVTPAQEAELRQVLIDRKAIVLRDQQISPQRFAEFIALFGETVKEDLQPDGENPPDVGIIHIRPAEKQTINFWHMDHSFRETPTPVLALYTKLLPECGGDTLFASLEAAYDGLSDEMKQRIAPLWTVHQVQLTQNSRRRYTEEQFQAMLRQKTRHPLVGYNPANGRKFLFVNTPVYCRYIDGMDEGESAALLDELYRHVQRPEYSFRLVWRPGTLIVWENTHCLHYPVADYFPHERKLLRVATTGQPILPVPAAA